MQEALRVQAGNHRYQQDELQALINSLRVALNDAFTQRDTVPQDKRAPTPNSPTVLLSTLKDLQISSQKTESLLESVRPQLGQLGQLEQGLGRVEGELSVVRRLLDTRPQVETQAAQPLLASPVSPKRAEREDQWESEAVVRRLEETQRTLGERIRTNTLYNAVFNYTATAITISALYLLLRGTG